MYIPSRLVCKYLAQFRRCINTSCFSPKPPVIRSPMQQKVQFRPKSKNDSCSKMVDVSNYLNVAVECALSEYIEKPAI